jgi:hypothetical protein
MPGIVMEARSPSKRTCNHDLGGRTCLTWIVHIRKPILASKWSRQLDSFRRLWTLSFRRRGERPYFPRGAFYRLGYRQAVFREVAIRSATGASLTGLGGHCWTGSV